MGPHPLFKTFFLHCTLETCFKTGLVVSGSNRRLPHTKRKTKTQRQTASPVFEETLEYCLHESGTVGISLAKLCPGSVGI